MKNTKRNLIELGRDFKGIGISVLTTGASLVSLVIDTVKMPISVCKDARDFIVSKKESKVAENTEDTEKVVIKKPKVKKVIQNAENIAMQS